MNVNFVMFVLQVVSVAMLIYIGIGITREQDEGDL